MEPGAIWGDLYSLAYELKMTVEDIQRMRVDEYLGWQWWFKERTEEMKRNQKHGATHSSL